MLSVARTLTLDHPLYSKAELIEHRRNTLRYARSFPPGSSVGRLPCRFAPCSRARIGLAHTLDAISLALFRIHLPTQGRNRKRNYKLLGPFPH